MIEEIGAAERLEHRKIAVVEIYFPVHIPVRLGEPVVAVGPRPTVPDLLQHRSCRRILLALATEHPLHEIDAPFALETHRHQIRVAALPFFVIVVIKINLSGERGRVAALGMEEHRRRTIGLRRRLKTFPDAVLATEIPDDLAPRRLALRQRKIPGVIHKPAVAEHRQRRDLGIVPCSAKRI